MADVRPFAGFRFDSKKMNLSRVLCPPYDVINADQAKKLRREPVNAVYLELPEGQGPARYRRAAQVWRRWRKSGFLIQDAAPSYYVCEETFLYKGKRYKRLGFLGALGVAPRAAKAVLAHERTLPKPKADRLRLLAAARANISPIFGLFADPSAAARRVLAVASKNRPHARGRTFGGVAYRLWRADDPRIIQALSRALASKKVLIADGHHRFEVSRAYYARRPCLERETTLAYLCPEEDAGLVVLSTHRIVRAAGIAEAAGRICRLTPCRSRQEMLKRLERTDNPYAYGLYDGRFAVAVPKNSAGCRSGLCVEWLGRRLLKNIDPSLIGYTPDAVQAVALARSLGATAIFVKPLRVPMIRRAVRAVGLLPPKSTYFYPKIATGLVFKSLAG